MLAVPGRHRSLTLLTVVLVSQVLLLAAQIRQDEHQVRLIRVWAVGTVTPLERAGTWTISKIRGTWNGYFALVHAKQENQALQAEVDRLRILNTQLVSQAAEAQRLATMLGFRDAHANVPMVAARVIAASADGSSHVIYINRGEGDGIRRNMAVITADGVVGKIFEVFSGTSEVLLVNDKEGAVGALLAGPRTEGVVGGTGDPLLQMKYVSNDENVTIGQQVLTSGEDRIFPKDIPVGTIKEAKQGAQFKQILVEPAAHLDRLEEVMVLLTRQEIMNKPANSKAETVPGPPAANSATVKRVP